MVSVFWYRFVRSVPCNTVHLRVHRWEIYRKCVYRSKRKRFLKMWQMWICDGIRSFSRSIVFSTSFAQNPSAHRFLAEKKNDKNIVDPYPLKLFESASNARTLLDSFAPSKRNCFYGFFSEPREKNVILKHVERKTRTNSTVDHNRDDDNAVTYK